MKNLYKYIVCILFFALFHVREATAQRDFAMQITVDKPVEAGDLVLFPGVKDKDSYWYMSKTVKLATNDDGSPKVSFIKWVYNEDNGEDEGLGGGVLHCVFGYGASTQQINEARTALRRVNGKGKIVGPVIFKSGTVTVAVPKLNDPEKQEVVAVAPAPTIQGAYVATNLQLDKRSASLLWESFDTPNPLVTFNFNMELAGYNSPLEAKITINREQIHNSRKMQAGVATPWLSAEVGSFFDEMIDNGAIEIEKIGENFEMQEAIDRAVEMATQEFFTPLGSSDGPNLSQLQGLNGQEPSFLDRASGLLNTARQDSRSENQRIRAENRQAEDRAERQNQRIREENRRERERTDRLNEDNREQMERERREAQENNDTSEDDEDDDSEGVTQATPTEAGITPENVSQDVYIPVEAQQRDEVTANTREEESVPSIAIVASYIQREVRISGKKVISFKETYPTTIPMPFGGNLGVSRTDCSKCFIEVNLSDPVFKQRQLLAVIDGFNQDNFSQFVNYASLQIKKTHQSGDITFDEVRVTRKNFSEEGNLFTLLYGWKGDNDRSKWLDYKYKVGWSFFGGKEFETDWIDSNRNTINLSAPLQQKIITIEAERDLLEEVGVRSIDVKIIYNLGGEDLQKQFTVNTSKDVLNGQVVIMLPKNKQEYDYEVTWRLWGGKEVKSGRRTTSFEVLQIDELPN